jgi:hypothetical protein
MTLGMLVLAVGVACSGPEPPCEIRVYDPLLIELLREGQERSATLRGLQQEFASSGWLLFVQRGWCPERSAFGCLIHHVGQFEGRWFLRVVVNPDRGRRDNVIATLAHELQHAIEVASAPGVTDAASIQALFRRIGHIRIKTRSVITYETDAAWRTEESVLRDLRAKKTGGNSR